MKLHTYCHIAVEDLVTKDILSYFCQRESEYGNKIYTHFWTDNRVNSGF
jgi:hypothetical protein